MGDAMWRLEDGRVTALASPGDMVAFSTIEQSVRASYLCMVAPHELPVLGCTLIVHCNGHFIHQSEHRSVRDAQQEARRAIMLAEELRELAP